MKPEVSSKATPNDEYQCFECLPEKRSYSKDLFCSSCKCHEKPSQPSFPSANSSFPPGELAEITEHIEQANELLLALGLERDDKNLRALQLSLRKLRNQFVSVKLVCHDEHQNHEGHLFDVGLNFILLETSVGNIIVIPFERINFIERRNQKRDRQDLQQPELINIDPCLRRSLTINFGHVVSKSPYLINLFFGLELILFLESFVGSFVYVKSDKSKNEIDGILSTVNKRRIELTVDNKKQGIDFDELCFIEIEQEALTRKFLLCNEHPIFM